MGLVYLPFVCVLICTERPHWVCSICSSRRLIDDATLFRCGWRSRFPRLIHCYYLPSHRIIVLIILHMFLISNSAQRPLALRRKTQSLHLPTHASCTPPDASMTLLDYPKTCLAELRFGSDSQLRWYTLDIRYRSR
jgi:hypothetical protein